MVRPPFAADLTDANGSREALKAAHDVTQVFYCTWSRQANEEENVRVNGLMARNLFEGIAEAPVKHAALVTGLKHYLGSFDDYAKVTPYTPFLEAARACRGRTSTMRKKTCCSRWPRNAASTGRCTARTR